MTETLTATLTTTQGTVTVRLFPDHAPKTVRNFVELAEGGREWTDPRTRARTKDKLYDGTVFHRVIAGFMIQGGDPLGTGTGGPGYEFADEIHPDLRFDKPYLLAMANAGPGTNGSQFFVTVGATPWLNGKHTIFGEVDEVAHCLRRVVGEQPDSDRPLRRRQRRGQRFCHRVIPFISRPAGPASSGLPLHLSPYRLNRTGNSPSGQMIEPRFPGHCDVPSTR